MKEQFFVTHTIRQTKVPALPVGLQIHHQSKSCTHNKIASCIFVEIDVFNCRSIKDQSSVSVSCKDVHRWFAINCCFMSDIQHSAPAAVSNRAVREIPPGSRKRPKRKARYGGVRAVSKQLNSHTQKTGVEYTLLTLTNRNQSVTTVTVQSCTCQRALKMGRFPPPCAHVPAGVILSAENFLP